MSSATPPRIGRVMSIQSGPTHGDDDRSPDMYDALRDLFLGGSDDQSASLRAHAPRQEPEPAGRIPGVETSFPLVEGLVLGHLPVQQSPWVMQYARDAATQRGGPVGLLRVREGEATLDLIGAPTGSPAISPQATLEEAIAEIAPIAKGLIVRVDATTEPILAGLPCVDALTLLTGADQAAVLGAYRTVKGLVGSGEDQLPNLRLAIMGSTPDKALPAAEKIQKAVESNLHVQVTVTACLARVGPGRSTLVFRGLVSEDVEAILDRAKVLMTRKPVPVPQAFRPSQRIPSPPSPLPFDVDEEPVEQSQVVSRLGNISTTAQPAAASRGEPQTTPTLSLASHVHGLVPSRIACPFQTGVEFAVDARGALNLLIHAASASEVGGAIGSLLAAASWAKSHASLIGMAMQSAGPGHDPHAAPALHLLTPSVKEYRGLPEAGIHLHLLARVEVEGKSGWFCTEVG